MSIVYFNHEYALEAHRLVLEESGGLPGIMKPGQLESIIDFVQNDNYYPTLEDKVIYLTYSVSMGHCFNDGNKRTSLALASYLMILNGKSTGIIDVFMHRMEGVIVAVAANRIDRELLGEIICSILGEHELSEESQLRLIHALEG